MNKTRIKQLRKVLKAECISYGELHEIETAFAQVPDSELREARENAMASDMLDEIEAYNLKCYQPKTGAKCSCKKGVQRDNCPNCEGTGMVIDFAAIRNPRAGLLSRTRRNITRRDT